MVERLEARATPLTFVAMLDEYLDAMGIDQADRVIDLGCGTGVGNRAILRRPRFQGSVLGVDLSPHLVEVARHHAQADGTADRAEFRACDTTSLDVGDASFDAAIAQTLLSHVPIRRQWSARRRVSCGPAGCSACSTPTTPPSPSATPTRHVGRHTTRR